MKQDMSTFVKIAVPFECKTKAHELGIQFNKVDRCWYISPQEKTQAEIILQEFYNKFYKNKEFYHTHKYDTEADKSYECVLQDNNKKSFCIEKSFSSWEDIIEKKDTLLTALIVRDYGMPAQEEFRTQILKILSTRTDGNYPIMYDGMMQCSESFAELYSKERVKSLIRSCITGERPYPEEIRNSNLSEEEKALLFMVTPL